MKYDCIIIGAGIGGLTCAADLARKGVKVLLCEKFIHAGGTASVFHRNGYKFPAGPLSFSFPSYVDNTLKELGIKERINFKRSHFQFKSQNIDVILSLPFKELTKELGQFSHEDESGISSFFEIMRDLAKAQMEILAESREFQKIQSQEHLNTDFTKKERSRLLTKYQTISAKELAEKLVKNDLLRVLLSSQSFEESNMSALLAARMWDMIAKTGIWYPDIGFDGINNLLVKTIIDAGGELRFSSPVYKITMSNGCANGIILKSGEHIAADTIVSTVDHRLTFFNMIGEEFIPNDFAKWVKSLQDSGSIFCVYLGINASNVNLKAFKADHIFYRDSMGEAQPWHENISSKDFFSGREYEICLWSGKDIHNAPHGKDALLLRANAPYNFFEKWRTPDGGRTKGYYEYKNRVSKYFIEAAENLLPGLSSAVEVMDASTPLTYQTWGGGSEGACAGWSWDRNDEMGTAFKSLIRTPVPNLYMAGYQAFSQLIIGGYATAMHSGNVVANMIVRQN